MNEVGNQPINGLSVTKSGVTFNFTDTTGADYDASGPGLMTFVQDPSIEGATNGELVSISFSQAFTTVDFGMALSTESPVPSLATVDLYDQGTLVLSTAFASTLTDPFAEGEFTYVGGPVDEITIAPDSSAANAFVLDNLSVDTPEPPTFQLLGSAILALAAGVLMRRKASQS